MKLLAEIPDLQPIYKEGQIVYIPVTIKELNVKSMDHMWVDLELPKNVSWDKETNTLVTGSDRLEEIAYA